MAFISRFMISSDLLLYSCISARVMSRDSIEERSKSSSFLLPKTNNEVDEDEETLDTIEVWGTNPIVTDGANTAIMAATRAVTIIVRDTMVSCFLVVDGLCSFVTLCQAKKGNAN